MVHNPLPETDLTRHRRLREQGSLDRGELDAILDAGFVCHLGVVVEGLPVVVPTVYGRDEESLYVHGSVASRSLAAGAPVCVTVTHVDGLVLARSVFEHGVNYRSAMIHGVPRKVTDPEEDGRTAAGSPSTPRRASGPTPAAPAAGNWPRPPFSPSPWKRPP